MQENVWEDEYKNPKLIRLDNTPTKAVVRFSKFLRKERGLPLSNINILDLGCGIGKNSLFLADFDKETNGATGFDVSSTALEHARRIAQEMGIKNADFRKQSIGTTWPVDNSSFDIILDVTSSNSLSETEREVYLNEIQRTLKPGGYLFVRALCKDGDANAKTLLKSNPGKEKDTYIMPEFGLVERVFSREDLLATYAHIGEMLYLDKETHYSKFKGRIYKRNFWVGVWVKK
jgi:SAM-dependent methyltransferase